MSVTQNIQLRIGGMTCAHCPPAIEKALAAVTGVTAAQVNPATKIAKIDYDPSRTKITSNSARQFGLLAIRVGTATARIPIKNMHCSSCVIRVELALQMTPGIVSARASLGSNAVDIEYQPEKVDFQEIRKAIESAGYRVAEPKIEPQNATLDPAEAANEEEYRTLMRKFWFAAAISLPVMVLSYPDLIPGLRDWMPMGSDTRRIVWALLGRAEPAGAGLGRLAVLYRHVGRAQAPRGQHAHADRHRHQRGLCSIRSWPSRGPDSFPTWRSPRCSGT